MSIGRLTKAGHDEDSCNRGVGEARLVIRKLFSDTTILSVVTRAPRWWRITQTEFEYCFITPPSSLLWWVWGDGGNERRVFYVTTSINGGDWIVAEAAEISVKIETEGTRYGTNGCSGSIDDKTFFNDIEGINLRNDLVSRSGIIAGTWWSAGEDTHRGVDSERKYKLFIKIFIFNKTDWEKMDGEILSCIFFLYIYSISSYVFVDTCVQEVHDNFVCLWAQRDIRHWTHIEIVGSWANMYSDYGTRTDINPWMLNPPVEH